MSDTLLRRDKNGVVTFQHNPHDSHVSYMRMPSLISLFNRLSHPPLTHGAGTPHTWHMAQARCAHMLSAK